MQETTMGADRRHGEGEALDPVALHARNLTRLGESIVVVASYPGSGAALVGNILLEAGLDYLDPYTEVIHSGGQVAAAPQRAAYRSRLAASDRRDREGGGGCAAHGRQVFVKTHRYPEEFRSVPVRAVVLLTRDPRDAVHSYYRWRQGFSESGEHGTFEEFLRRPASSGRPPVLDWAEFTRQWADQALPLRFEDVKHDPVRAMGGLLAGLEIECDRARLSAAADRSSFEAMRAHEDRRAPGPGARIMRRGQVGEWREWYTPRLAAFFETAEVRRLATRFGYEV